MIEQEQLEEMRRIVYDMTGRLLSTQADDYVGRIELRVAYTRLYNLMWMTVKHGIQ